jgi:adenosine deaminase
VPLIHTSTPPNGRHSGRDIGHGGEPRGPNDLISDALAHGAHRIGHGVRLQADTSVNPDGGLVLGPLAQFVLDHQIHLEMAPTCNVQIGATPSIDQHPIGAFLRAGFNVGINTDNRLMSNVMPSSELLAVTAAFDLNADEVRRLTTNAIESAFAPMAARRAIIFAIG